jgi:hypothetical protein
VRPDDLSDALALLARLEDVKSDEDYSIIARSEDELSHVMESLRDDDDDEDEEEDAGGSSSSNAMLKELAACLDDELFEVPCQIEGLKITLDTDESLNADADCKTLIRALFRARFSKIWKMTED